MNPADQPAAPQTPEQPAKGKHMTVRIIEDDEQIAELIAAVFRHRHDVEARLTTDNFGALMAHEPWEGIDAAFIDLMLPGIEGEEIARWVRDNEPSVRRIVVSAKHPPPPDQDDWAEVYIAKPFTFDDIYQALFPGEQRPQ